MSKDIPVYQDCNFESQDVSETTPETPSAAVMQLNCSQSPKNAFQYHSKSKSGAIASDCVKKHRFCRICWDVRDQGDSLVSPCSCSGTQKFVHISCLGEWQKTVLRSNLGDERAYRCGVCKTVYSISPISTNKWKGYRLKACKALLLVSCVLSLYYGATYPLWPLLIIFGMLTLPNVGQIRPSNKTYLMFVLVSTIAFSAVLFSGSSHVSKYIHQLHTIPKDQNAPMPPVLRPGILLFASNAIKGSIFSRSVVLILEYTPMRGSQGVILNQRMESRFERDCFIESRSSKRGHTREIDCDDDDEGDIVTGPVHLFGGPVGLPGEGPAKERLVTLHTFDSVRGSRYIQLRGDSNEKIYFGGVMSDVLREANRTNIDEYPVYIFHGVSAWSPGQLESEVQSGAWNTRYVSYDELLDLIDFGEMPGTTV